MIIQSIVNIAEICARFSISHAVISPGSRSAPITLAFARQPDIQTHMIPDERTAGFIAMGIAQTTASTVVVVCTSGTAVLNLSPAIAEAYYQKIPLIIFTADRPPEWIDQADGQTIRQVGIFENIAKRSFSLPVDEGNSNEILQFNKTISEALNSAQLQPKGPVHVNVPIREPFYPKPGESFEADLNIHVSKIRETEKLVSKDEWDDLAGIIQKYSKILIVAGQHFPSNKHVELISKLIEGGSFTVIGDITSNHHPIKGLVLQPDLILFNEQNFANAKLQPELLITFGGPVLSKRLKQFLRVAEIQEHWHISEDGIGPDTFQSLTRTISTDIEYFLGKLHSKSTNHLVEERKQYHRLWHVQWQKAINQFAEHINTSAFGDLKAIKTIMDRLPDDASLHLGNSMPVRYANMIVFGHRKSSVTIYANRGTCGIDGSLSTAVGHSIASKNLQVMLIGDMSFFYDSNALWHKELNNNLRIIIINNSGGGIFRLIPGSESQPELEAYFELRNQRSAEWIAKDYNLEYIACDEQNGLYEGLDGFFETSSRPRILEVFTDPEINQGVYKDLINYLNR